MFTTNNLTQLASEFLNAVLNARPEVVALAKKLRCERWTKDMNTSRCVELLSQVENETQLMNVLSAASTQNPFVILRGDPLVEACASSIVSDKVYEMAKKKGIRNYPGLVCDTLKRYSDDRVVEGLKRYERVFSPPEEIVTGILEHPNFTELLDHCVNARKHLTELHKRLTAKIADPPEYLIKVTQEAFNETEQRVLRDAVDEFDLEKSTILSKSELAQRYVASTPEDNPELFAGIGENPELVKKIVEIQFDTLEPLEQYKLVEPWLLPGIEKPDSTEMIFKHYGPLCGFASEDDCQIDHKFEHCYAYGHRMLTCNCSKIRDDYINDCVGGEYDWFDGRCDNCCSIIKSRRYAARLPEFDGAKMERWFGCYCSTDCATKAAGVTYTHDDEHQAIYNTIVNDIFYQLNTIGIYDV